MHPSPAALDLDSPYPLGGEQIARYQRDGYIKLAGVLSPETLARYGAEITAQVQRRSGWAKPLAQRDTYGKAFLQVANLWQESAIVETFVRSRRLAGIASALMGTAGVRLYHDQALYKEAGGGHTPWHVDQHYWPLASDRCVTAWIPLQAVPVEMGPLAFAVGSQHLLTGRDLSISDESEATMQRTLRDFPVDEAPFALGEVSFHAGWTFHRAGPNRTAQPRAVMTIIYMDRDMRVAAAPTRAQEGDLAIWLPGARVGELAATPLNPILYG